jgi:hypothetical protein
MSVRFTYSRSASWTITTLAVLAASALWIAAPLPRFFGCRIRRSMRAAPWSRCRIAPVSSVEQLVVHRDQDREAQVLGREWSAGANVSHRRALLLVCRPPRVRHDQPKAHRQARL